MSRGRTIGRAARRALARGRRGRVIARFARSFYVASGGGIACVGERGLGRGPLNALVPRLERLPAAGERFSSAGGRLRFSGGLSLSLRGARPWRPPAPPRRPRGRLRVPVIREIFPAESSALARWITAGAKGRAPAAAARQVGRGGGLTPAGDDLIGGALIALRALGRRALAARVARWALALARRRTSRISRAHLACAAAGEGHESLHRALAAILAGRGDPGRELAALGRVGHTSGMDALAGALLVLRTCR